MTATQQQEAPGTHYPVLIIGAGINGCGVFRDLCLQGVDCLLIDRGDICEGASGASSRLIHGGIKYLETGEFRLVRESAMERNRLLRNAPHYVKPLETILPVRSWFGGIAASAKRFLGFKTKLRERGAIIVAAGLRAYDAYNRQVRALPDHRFLGRQQLRTEYPGLDSGIIAAGLYFEGHITHAERLGLELVLDGLAVNPGSALLTYSGATAGKAPGSICITDLITGKNHGVTADVIINAGGAWIDKVNEGLGVTSRHMGGSKGSHLIVDNPLLLAALKGRMIYFGTADGRVNLIYPFFGHVLVGSTDIPVTDPDEAICDDGETDYLLSSVAEIFPSIPITRDRILLTYCGVRPLPRAEGADIGTVSRDHAIVRDLLPGSQRPVLSLIGGKWTTFRAFSAQAADDVLALLGRPRRVSTEDIAIGGGRGFPVDAAAAQQWTRSLAELHGLTLARSETLLARYGTKAEKLAVAIAATTDSPLATLPGYSHAEIAWLCRQEPLRRLSDLLFRRTAIAMEGLLTPEAIAETAHIAARTLGWSAERTAQENVLATSEFTRRLPRLKHAA